eukprot:765020-Hanusia_phi.AAC.4
MSRRTARGVTVCPALPQDFRQPPILSLRHGPTDARAHCRLCDELERQHAPVTHARSSQGQEQARDLSAARPGLPPRPCELLKGLQVMCLSSRWRAMPLAEGTSQLLVAGGSKVEEDKAEAEAHMVRRRRRDEKRQVERRGGNRDT